MTSRVAKTITHLTFVDVETTGLVGPRDRVDQIVEIALAKVNIKTRNIEAWYESLIYPEYGPQTYMSLEGCRRWDLGDYHLDRGTFNDVDWTTGKLIRTVLKEIGPLLNGATLAGNNPAFDRDHIVREYDQWYIPVPDLDYHLIDLCSPAMLLVMSGVCEGVSLKNSRSWAGLEGEQAHRAGQDVRDAIKVFFKLADVVQRGLLAIDTCPPAFQG